MLDQNINRFIQSVFEHSEKVFFSETSKSQKRSLSSNHSVVLEGMQRIDIAGVLAKIGICEDTSQCTLRVWSVPSFPNKQPVIG